MTDAPIPILSRLAALCRRSGPRYTVLLSARLVTAAGTFPVTIRDLSLEGTMINGTGLPRVGCRLLLHRRLLVLPATVIWRSGNRAGLRFEQPLTEEQLYREVDRTRLVAEPELQASVAA
jgi:hypothetical protein